MKTNKNKSFWLDVNCDFIYNSEVPFSRIKYKYTKDFAIVPKYFTSKVNVKTLQVMKNRNYGLISETFLDYTFEKVKHEKIY